MQAMQSPLFCFLLACNFNQFVVCSWWYLATPSAYQLTTFKADYKNECRQMQYLVARQRELCTLSKNMLQVVSSGARMGLQQCQYQFRERHWNCSAEFDHITLPKINPKKRYKHSKVNNSRELMFAIQSDAPAKDIGDVFGGSLKYHSREKAYVHAISAAGVAFAVTRACSSGNLPSCDCDRNVHLRRKKKTEQNFEYGGCSEDLAYGERLSRDFVDSNDLAKEWADPAPKLMNLHNNEAGRRAIRRNTQLMCKCHGVSGSCTTKICWRKMRDFEKVGTTLYRKFDQAIRVKFAPKKHKLKPALHGLRTPKKRDLVYIQESPDYCMTDLKQGIYGTKGRICNINSYGIDNCRLLCCGRGYTTKVVEVIEECDCKFVWCCEVKCQICKRKVENHFCK